MKNIRQLRQILSGAVKPIERVGVTEWSEKYGRLPSDSAEPGRYRVDRTPYMRQVMNAFTEPDIKRIVVKSAAQIGKSSVLLNIVGHTAHLNPANILIIQPTLSEAEDFSKARLAKFIRDCKVLTPLFYEKERTRDANNTILSKFFKGGRIILVGANSSSGLASRPIKILLCDEVDRYPASASGNEGDPIALAEKRLSTFFDSKLAMFSTPTVEGQSRIDLEYLLGTQEEWRHECPNCHEFHSLNVDDMISDYDEQKDLAGNRIVLVKSVAWRCPDCGLEFSEVEMKNAAQKYFALNESARANGIRSFWVNGFSSPWLSWKDIMREWLEAQGNPQLEAVVMNTRFGLSYRYEKKVADEMELLGRLESYGSELPAQVQLLTCGVDVQANRLHYLIMGHAPQELYGIQYGVIFGKPTDAKTWRKLDEVINRGYRKSGNIRGTGAETLTIARCFIDSGFATDMVYDYCRGKNRTFPVKGIGTIGASFLHQFSPQKDKGVMLVVLGVNDGKAQVFSRLDKIHFGRDDAMERGFDMTFFKEMTSEHAVLKKSGGRLIEIYEKIGRGSRNEALDCLVYALAAAKSLTGDDEATFYQQLLQPEKKPARKIRQASIDIW